MIPDPVRGNIEVTGIPVIEAWSSSSRVAPQSFIKKRWLHFTSSFTDPLVVPLTVAKFFA